MKIENAVHLIWQVVSTLLALMATKYIIGSVAASFAFAYVCGVYVADRKVLGGEVPATGRSADDFCELLSRLKLIYCQRKTLLQD